MFTITIVEVRGYEVTGSVFGRVMGTFGLNVPTMRDAVAWVASNLADPWATSATDRVCQAEYNVGSYWGETQWRVTPRYA